MPIAARSSARHVRREVTGQSIAKRRESIAAFEQWQRHWSAPVPVETMVPAPQTALKRADTARSVAHSR